VVTAAPWCFTELVGQGDGRRSSPKKHDSGEAAQAAVHDGGGRWRAPTTSAKKVKCEVVLKKEKRWLRVDFTE
jgi:hypothetical protein